MSTFIDRLETDLVRVCDAPIAARRSWPAPLQRLSRRERLRMLAALTAVAAVATAAAVTAAAVGSIVHTLPPSCSAVVVNGVTYQNCGGTYYQPQFSGTNVNYTVVNPPQ